MRKVILFIAMSLDGYIADRNGKVDWLNGQDDHVENLNTYSIFIEGDDTVVMGWNTYHQIITELSPKEWVYSGLASYVITHRTPAPAEQITFTQESPCSLVRRLKQEQGKAIWICGGAAIIQPLILEDLIDEYYISIIPSILGDGIRLFGKMPAEMRLNLISTQTYNGITELVYSRR